MTVSPSTARRNRKSPARGPAAPSVPPALVEEDDGSPRYLQIARELTAAIASGRYPVGSRLPTELELCEHFAISRFTAREAVRVLSSAGLVTRRQRVGTVVIATPDEARYTHAASSISDLFQYAQDTELRLVYIGKLALARERAQQFGAQVGDEWTYAMGLRTESALEPGKTGRPICVTRLFLSPVLAGIDAKLRERKTGLRDHRARVQGQHPARRAGAAKRRARRRRCRQPRQRARLACAARSATLFRRPRPAARGGREHPPRRPVHLPDAAAQVGPR